MVYAFEERAADLIKSGRRFCGMVRSVVELYGNALVANDEIFLVLDAAV